MKNFKKAYEKLNKQQRQAVDSIDGPLMVVAGPGTGKTEVLAIRIANILRKKDVPAGSLLCLTFTDAAAVNMRNRLVDLIGEEGYKIPVFTFHSLCREIIEENPDYFYKGAKFDPADDITKTSIIEEILESLNYDDPLTSRHPELGYTYLNDIKNAISCIKEGGLTPKEFHKAIDHNQQVLKDINPKVSEVFDKRISKSIRPEVEELVRWLENYEEEFPVAHYKPLSNMLAGSLRKALEGEGTKKITAWKNDNTKKQNGKRILRDSYYIEKQQSLADVYETYRKEVYERGFYDFSDMILDVIDVLESEDSLRYDLQERFLYISVDEFQDTSGVQMRLLRLLTKDEPHNRPNVCVVGDDDQAIYKFQGAELSNILDFKDFYDNPEIVTLTKSYRSKSEVLEAAQKVIKKGEYRLEKKMEEVEKDLTSDRGEGGQIKLKNFETKQEEYSYVTEKIEEIISKGVEPEEIAVVARTHQQLKEINPYFKKRDIATFAERKEDVLKKPLVLQIIKMIRFAYLLLEGDRKKAEELLPEILSYPFWELDREKVWKLARRSYENRSSWLEEMEKESQLKEVKKFLEELSSKARHVPARELVDFAIGNKTGDFESPFKSFYFSEKKRKNSPGNYFRFLSALKTFTEKLEDYERSAPVEAKDLLEFVEIHEENNLSIPDKNPLIEQGEAVSLVTAHSVKGKEYNTVFILNCKHEVWGKSKGRSKLPFQSNMPLERAGETRDDRLRLFYVAMTRAENKLFLTSHDKKRESKNYTPLEFIDHVEKENTSLEVNNEQAEAEWESFHSPPFIKQEEKVLKKALENFKLSPTGFNKYLNVANEGPRKFLEETLLRFPSKKPVPAAFGTAIHETLKEASVNLQRDNGLLPLEELLSVFESNLKKERLSDKDFEKMLERGKDGLKKYYKEKKDEFSKEDIVEKNFAGQGCVVEGVEITGRIDKLKVDGDKIIVVDYKTGSPIKRWNPSGRWNKLKAWKYENQLIFYKLLVENSRDFERKTVEEGKLEFVEPTDSGEIITLNLNIDQEKVDRCKSLIKEVDKKIKNLEFSEVDVGERGKLEDVKDFEEKLLN